MELTVSWKESCEEVSDRKWVASVAVPSEGGRQRIPRLAPVESCDSYRNYRKRSRCLHVLCTKT